jgi:hypothetical protein
MEPDESLCRLRQYVVRSGKGREEYVFQKKVAAVRRRIPRLR